MKVIGITGYAQSGKDTVGTYLGKVWGYQRVGFADAVRDAVYLMDPILFQEDEEEFIHVQQHVDEYGWDVAKTDGSDVRRLLQTMGTEVGRMLLGENVWIDIARRKMEGMEKVVLTDVRFANEADFIHEHGGVVIKIDRPGVWAVNAHSSETLDFPVDYTINNSGILDNLYDELDSLLISME